MTRHELLRVFISYSRADQHQAHELEKKLESEGFAPVWDSNNHAGEPFRHQIERQISHAHVFMPLLSKASATSKWVHNEIGLAIGRNVPVLPICIEGAKPEGIVTDLQPEQATKVKDLRDLRDPIEWLVCQHSNKGLYSRCEFVEERTEAIVSHTEEILRIQGSDGSRAMRHIACFGSLSIPASRWDRAWAKRNRRQPQGPTYRKEAMSRERVLLGRYAKLHGCDLVVHPYHQELYSTEIRMRCKLLVKFIDSCEDGRIRVKISEFAEGENQLIIGDWFHAVSNSPKTDGFRHTFFTTHAPTVLKQWQDFEHRFPGGSDWMYEKKEAIAGIKRFVKRKLKEHQDPT